MQRLSAESLDDKRFCFGRGVGKADYLLFSRSVIIETKTVINDPKWRVEQAIAEHLQKTGIEIHGAVWSHRLFKSIADSRSFHNKVAREMTRTIESYCRDADKQLRDTADHLGLSSTKILVILNEDRYFFDPNMVVDRVLHFLRQKQRSIDFCLLLFESHQIEVAGRRVEAMTCVASDGVGPSDYSAVRRLMDAWAAHQGLARLPEISENQGVDYVPRNWP